MRSKDKEIIQDDKGLKNIPLFFHFLFFFLFFPLLKKEEIGKKITKLTWCYDMRQFDPFFLINFGCAGSMWFDDFQAFDFTWFL